MYRRHAIIFKKVSFRWDKMFKQEQNEKLSSSVAAEYRVIRDFFRKKIIEIIYYRTRGRLGKRL